MDAPAEWGQDPAGVRVTRRAGGGVVLALEPGVDFPAVLRAAQASVSVEHFGVESGGLIDLSLRLVSA